MFQFHYGTIGRVNGTVLTSYLKTFQFHYGTIGSPPVALFNSLNPGFNSTMVRLVVLAIADAPPCEICFNSTMVRLVVAPVNNSIHSLYQFQFHYGTIGRCRTRFIDRSN